MTGQSGGETRHGAGIGSRLRSARERSDLTVEEAAHRLHVDPAVLQALEAEDFGSLGAPIYVKSYLGRYADLVGESAESLQQLLSSAVIPPPDLTRIPRARVTGNRLVGPIAIAVIAALIVAGSLWWGVSRWREHHLMLLPASRTVPQRLVAQSTPRAAAREPSGSATAAFRAAHADKAGQTAASPPKGEVRITLKFSAPSWLEVDDASGRRLYHAMTPAGGGGAFPGPGPAPVRLGSAPGGALRDRVTATRRGGPGLTAPGTGRTGPVPACGRARLRSGAASAGRATGAGQGCGHHRGHSRQSAGGVRAGGRAAWHRG